MIEAGCNPSVARKRNLIHNPVADFMPNCISLLAIAATGILLSGCFMSEAPIFPQRSAAPAFGEGGRYGVFEHVADDRYRRQEAFVVKHRGDGGYDFVNEKGDVLPISFHALSSGLFVGQAKLEKDKDGYEYGYTVLRATDNEALLYLPQCDKQDKAKLAAFGVEFRGKYDCVVDRIADPLGLFATLELGEPVSKMVHE